MLKEATKAHVQGDEEMAYVFYMKYFGLINLVKKHKDFEKNKSNLTRTLGPNREIMCRMDELAAIKESLISRYKAKLKESVAKIPDAIEEMSCDEPVASKPSIQCRELFDLIRDPNEKIIIIDCRGKEEYLASRLEFKNLFNIPAEHIRKGFVKG